MSADPLKEKRESRAMCAHLNVKYAPVDHGNGTASDRWTCVLCGHDFWPKQWLFPAPWQRAEAALAQGSAPRADLANGPTDADRAQLKAELVKTDKLNSYWKSESGAELVTTLDAVAEHQKTEQREAAQGSAGAREAHAPNLPFSESPSMNLSEVQTFQKLSVWLRENALPPYKQILAALAAKIEELERVERVRPDDVDEALIWIIGERHHQRVREEMAAYLNDKMAMRALAAHSAAPRKREVLLEELLRKTLYHLPFENSQSRPAVGKTETFCMECEQYSFEGWDAVKHKETCTYARIIAALSQDKPTRAGEPK